MPKKNKSEAEEESDTQQKSDLIKNEGISFNFGSFESMKNALDLLDRLVLGEQLTTEQYKQVSALAYTLRGAKSEQHNGYSNYETWLIIEAISNTPALKEIWDHYAEQTIKDYERIRVEHPSFTVDEAMNYGLCHVLKYHFEVIVERVILKWGFDGMIAKEQREAETDMLRGILLNAVDIHFEEIAAELIRDAKERLQDAEAEDTLAEQISEQR